MSSLPPTSPQQPKFLDRFRTALQIRGRPPEVVEAFARWVRDFILFHSLRPPETMGEAVRPALQRERNRAGLSLERRRRLDRLLGGLAIPSGDRLRELRAVEVLERIGTPEARQVLRAWRKEWPRPT